MVSLFTPERSLPATLGTALFSAGLLASVLAAPHAHGYGGCRSDPLVTLPNGITVDLHAQIGTALSDVRHIDYVLHGPAISTSSTVPSGAIAVGSGWYVATYPDGTGPISSLTYVPDSKKHDYYADITVTTGASSVPVTAYLDWVAGGKHNSGTAQVTGFAGQSVETPVLRVVCANQCNR